MAPARGPISKRRKGGIAPETTRCLAIRTMILARIVTIAVAATTASHSQDRWTHKLMKTTTEANAAASALNNSGAIDRVRSRWTLGRGGASKDQRQLLVQR